MAELIADGRAVRLGDALISRGGYEALAAHVERICAQAHRKTPLRAGAPREEVRSAIGLAPKRWSALVEWLIADGRVVQRGSALALPSHVVRLGPDDEARWTKARAALAGAPLQPPSVQQLESEYGIGRELLAAVAERGDIVRVGDHAAFLPEAVARFAETVVAELETAKSITVGRARDLSGSSRKHVLPLLQYLDDEGVTRRQGDDRILLLAPDAARTRIRTLTTHREGHS
jgi:selenocysteine-specific elongation factor